MIRNENLHFCAPNDDAVNDHRSIRITSNKNRFRFVTFTALASLCLLMCASSAVADSKNKRSSAKTETRSRRVADNHRSSSKRSVASKHKVADKRSVVSKRNVATKRNVASKRYVADKKRSSVKLASKQDNLRTRRRVNIHETTKVRESAIKRPTVPNVRQTVIISPMQANNRDATRPTLVNDIVIISEAREIPTASRVSSVTRGTGSSNNMPSIWPVAGGIRGGFGVRHNPFGGRGSEFHKGQDISAPYGSQVIATADGVVVISGWLRGYGQVVYVDHGNGISTRYGHLSRIDVMVGQTIKRGDQLGLVGSTGRSTGPHLHYEVRVDGQATNPIPYLPTIPAQPVTTTPASR
jgi:murein DD-endopeptidase MepM/ murein hydrolase activator NlpD